MSCWLHMNCCVITPPFPMSYSLLRSDETSSKRTTPRNWGCLQEEEHGFSLLSGCWLSYRQSQAHEDAASQAEESEKVLGILTHDPFPVGGGICEPSMACLSTLKVWARGGVGNSRRKSHRGAGTPLFSMGGMPEFSTGPEDILKVTGFKVPGRSSQQKMAVRWLQKLRVEEGKISAGLCVTHMDVRGCTVCRSSGCLQVIHRQLAKDQGMEASRDRQE